MPASAHDVTGIRVLQFIPLLYFGGAERLATQIAAELARRGAEVVVASDLSDPIDFVPILTRAGMPLEHVPFARPRPLAFARSVLTFAALLRRREPHVVHAHNPAAAMVAAIARMVARRPHVAIVTTYHGVRPHRRRLAGRVLRGGELVVAVGRSAERQLRTFVPARRLVLIENAVAVRTERDRESVRREFVAGDEPLIVSVGRYWEQKDHPLLIDSLAELAGRGRRFKALIVGSGPLHRELEARVRARGLDDRVVVTGARADAVDLVAAADVLAHTAAWEGLPLVLLETMTLGTPIVAVTAVGVSDLVEDGVTGILVEERSPAAIADALERVLDDPELAHRVAAGGRAFVTRHHSFERMVDEHVAVYLRAMRMRA
jgi:glycosyltransferase involved in cell wall biosynthesis